MKQIMDDFGARDIVSCDSAGTISNLFALRCEKTPDLSAYMQYDHLNEKWLSYTWKQVNGEMERYAEALAGLDLEPGDRVAVYLENCLEWVLFDIAAMRLGLVVVPLYLMDNVDNISYVLADSGSKLIFLRNEERWNKLSRIKDIFSDLRYVLFLEGNGPCERDVGLTCLWLNNVLPEAPAGNMHLEKRSPDSPATIVYTSGTTGRPKGVVLSHKNILSNAEAVLQIISAYPDDLFLSFLPLSHTFERTAGYYIPMMAGSTVAYARSIPDLAEDIRNLHPTILIAVPRIYEKIYAKINDRLERKGKLSNLLFCWTLKMGHKRFEAQQHKRKLSFIQQVAWVILNKLVASKVLKSFGGRLRISVSGGAPLGLKISDFFLSLGVPLIQGYGLTESSPVVSANSLDDNNPASVGRPLPGIEVRVDSQGELIVKGSNIMLGYWNKEEETREVLSPEGWLKTGDLVSIEQGRIVIRGRLKDILVTSTGEKISPSDLETAILQDQLFQQVIVVGDHKPYIVAVVVVNFIAWKKLADEFGLDPGELSSLRHPMIKKEVLRRCERQTLLFPSYARIRDVCLTLLPWTIENGLVTPTLKVKRQEVEKRLTQQISELYRGHYIP